MLHPGFKYPLGGLRCPFWELENPSGAKSRFWKPLTPFWDPNVPLWVRMPSKGGQRGVQRRSPGPKRPPFWVHSRSRRSCPAVPASEPPASAALQPHSPWRGPGCPERGDQGSSGGGSSCSSLSSAARPRLYTHCPQRAPPPPPPPPPAPTVPQRPPRAPRLTRPRPARSARRRTAALTDPSAPLPALPGPRISRSHPVRGWVCGPPRARAPAAGLLSVAARPAPCSHSTFLLGGGALLGGA